MHGHISKWSERTPSWSKTRTENGRIEKSNHNDRPPTRRTPERDKIGKGAVIIILCSCQPRSVHLFKGCALVKKMVQKLPCINRPMKEPEVYRTEYVKKSMMHDVDSHWAFYDQKCLRHLASAMLTCHANCPKRDIIVITADVRYFCKM